MKTLEVIRSADVDRRLDRPSIPFCRSLLPASTGWQTRAFP